MLEINGIAVSNGIAVAKAYCLKEPDLSFEKVKVTDIDAEKSRLKEAFEKAKLELEEIREIALRKFGKKRLLFFQLTY